LNCTSGFTALGPLHVCEEPAAQFNLHSTRINGVVANRFHLTWRKQPALPEWRVPHGAPFVAVKREPGARPVFFIKRHTRVWSSGGLCKTNSRFYRPLSDKTKLHHTRGGALKLTRTDRGCLGRCFSHAPKETTRHGSARATRTQRRGRNEAVVIRVLI